MTNPPALLKITTWVHRFIVGWACILGMVGLAIFQTVRGWVV